MKVYGYCRVSTKQQSIDRQVANIKAVYPTAEIYSESYTGTKMDRPEFTKLVKRVAAGDTIVFDAVDRMSRTADEGVQVYMDLYTKGVNLVFIKHPYINTAVYRDALSKSVPMTGTAVDHILSGINEYFKAIAAEQVKLAFAQAQAEVESLHRRTSEGMKAAHAGAKISEARTGNKYQSKKAQAAKEVIRKHSKDFGGSLEDVDCMKLAGISRNTYYKCKRELREAGL